ncbi:MAG TPA: DNA mismatch repair endonuclease MutL [Gemmatimonadaceae bacterium]|nr:DNA mismatch repair endonuclease MutL [Gemmatimonadaceae bacterium]
MDVRCANNGLTPGSARVEIAAVPRIAILPNAVADQIAAGEVVERPASVVKELVENALDAGATHVDIAVREGGRATIRVSDDGHGMDRADAAASLSRHATSKITRAEDLVGIASFGFRGEALPSIASVSTLTLETAQADGDATVVRASHGTIAGVTPGARRRGTTVTVDGLFAQVPARQKFLRAARTEWRAISDLLVSIAVLRPDVSFTASHDDKQVFAWPAASSLRERVAAVWGVDAAQGFIAVDDVDGPVRVHGLAEKPGDVGTSARRFWLAVNGRIVRDNGVVRAAESAYRTTIPAGVRPSLLLLIDLPGEDVDVNVHPAKAEVRFRDRWSLERVVERAVRRALGTTESAMGIRTWTPAPRIAIPVDVDALRSRTGGPLFTEAQRTPVHAAVANAPEPDVAEEVVVEVPPLQQIRRTWLLAEREDGVLLIDQHSAHERVLYERFMATLERGAAPAQRLLLPLTLHLSPAESDAFDAHRDVFTALGFEIEGFGGDTLIVNAVPMPHARFDAERCLRESLAALAGDRSPSVHARHEKLAATVACKAAVKAGDALSPAEMRALYIDLARTTLAAHDVHGRATIVLFPWDELERRFGRQ